MGDDPAPGAPTGRAGTSGVGSVDLDAAAGSLPFPLRLPDPALTGELLDAEVDPSVPVGLIELRYDGVTLVEIGSQRDAPPILGKLLPAGTTVTPVTVGDRPGSWLTGDPHEVMSMDPDGEIRVDTVRRAGDVLESGGRWRDLPHRGRAVARGRARRSRRRCADRPLPASSSASARGARRPRRPRRPEGTSTTRPV